MRRLRAPYNRPLYRERRHLPSLPMWLATSGSLGVLHLSERAGGATRRDEHLATSQRSYTGDDRTRLGGSDQFRTAGSRDRRTMADADRAGALSGRARGTTLRDR